MGSIDDAIAVMPVPAREHLRRVVEIARAIAPEAVDGVSYGMPALKLAGKPLIGIASTTTHLSLFPFSPSAVDAVRGDLDGFSLSKGTIRFTPGHPIPDDVVEHVVRARMAEIHGQRLD